MTETAVAPAAEVPVTQASSKKTKSPKKAAGVKKPATKQNHPPTGEMVNAAIVALKDKKGSSLQAIKKYIASQYKVDVDKQSIFIKKYIKSAVAKKTIVQTKGSGASGSFKLAVKPESEKKKVAKKPVAAKKPAAAKKPVAAKKPAAATKKPAAKKTKVAAKPKEGAVKKPAAAKKPAAKKPVIAKKSPAKPKAAKPVKAKTAKAPTKPKTPKPKKAAART